jgi:hypothetical protein
MFVASNRLFYFQVLEYETLGNHAETRQGPGGLQKKGYRPGVRVSVCRCNLEATKKSRLSLKKLTFCARACPASAQRIIVNKVRNLLLSSIKITSPDSNGRDRSRNVRWSHLPLKIGAAGSRRLGGAMVAMFLQCFSRKRSVLGRWSLGLPTDKSARRIWSQKMHICRWFLNVELGVRKRV